VTVENTESPDFSSEAARSFDWPLIAVLTTIAALNYCDRMAMAAVFPLLRTDLGVSDVGLGAIGSAFLWTYALGSPFAGWLADRRSRTRMVLLSVLGWSLVTMATGLTYSVNQLMAMRLLLGFAECAYLPAAVGLLADHHGPRHRGRAISLHTAGLGIGAVIGTTAAGYLGQHYGWRSTFLILGGVGVILAGVAAVVLRGKDVPSVPADGPAFEGARAHSSLRTVLRIPSYWVLLVQSMIVSLGIWLFLNWLPLYFRDTFSLSLVGAGFFGAALLEFPGLFGVVVGGQISDFVARRKSVNRMLVQSICYFIGGALLLTFTTRAAFALVASAVFVFSFLRSLASANEGPLLCDLLAPRQRSTAIGLMNSANTFAGGIGVLGAGVLKQNYSLATIFGSVSILVFGAAALTGVGYYFLLPRDLRLRTTGEAEVETVAR
jgi:predicted MFS family arabinose efflux permease